MRVGLVRSIKPSPFGKQIVHERVIESVARPRAPLALLAFLAASLAVHAAVIVALPEFSLKREPIPLTVLEVVLVQTVPPRPLAVAEARPSPVPSPAPPVRPKGVTSPLPPKSNPKPPVAAAAPSLLTLPEPAPSPAPAVRSKAGHSRSASTSITTPLTAAAEPPQFTLPEAAPDVEVAAPAERPGPIAGAETVSAPQVAIAAPTPPRFSASYLQNPAPRYPLAARRAGEQGTVTLKVMVTREGLPQRVKVEQTSGSSRLDAAALDAVRQWRFVPARRGATPVDSWVLVPVVFRLEEPS